VGLDPLAAATIRVARRLTRDIDVDNSCGGSSLDDETRDGMPLTDEGRDGLPLADEGKNSLLLDDEGRDGLRLDSNDGDGLSLGGRPQLSTTQPIAGNDGDGFVLEMLPRLQRATLRATFEYLTGVSVACAVASHGVAPEPQHAPAAAATAAAASDGLPIAYPCTLPAAASVAAWEDEYLKAATALRHLIPARARSLWMASDWLYGLSPVGRLEARSIRAARRLPLLALRAARPGSPLALLAKGVAHGGGGAGNNRVGMTVLRRLWGMCKGGAGDDASGALRASCTPTKALLDETVTLLFAGHDTQSATLSWALLRLAGDQPAQETLNPKP